MKTHIWNQTEPFPDKVNFVDSNNVLLGYALGQYCCENAYWTISESPDGENPLHRGDGSESKEIELENYRFDPTYFQRHDDESIETYVATFKLVGTPRWGGPKLPDLFLRLVNQQNGYYSHGFTFRGDTVIEDAL